MSNTSSSAVSSSYSPVTIRNGQVIRGITADRSIAAANLSNSFSSAIPDLYM